MSGQTAGFAQMYEGQRAISFARQESADDADIDLTVPAPGEGLALVLHEARASFENNSDHVWSITFTDRGGTTRTLEFETGRSGGVAFPRASVAGIVTKVNTKIDLFVPASGTGGVVARATIQWAEVDADVIGNLVGKIIRPVG